MNAPTFDRLLRYFKHGHLNPSAPTERIKSAMEPLFAALEPLAPLKENNEAKAIWIKVPRGDISDYDSFEDLKDYGEVETYEEYEKRWKEDYPDEYKWYELVIVESFNRDGSLDFRAVAFGDKTIISARMDEGEGRYSFTEDAAVELCTLLTAEAEAAMEKLRDGTYNAEVNAELPFEFKTGVLRRSIMWEKEPEYRERTLKDMSHELLDRFEQLIISGYNDEEKIGRLDTMTANDFFRACAIGYQACGYDGTDLSPVERYLAHADGRDEGLTGKGYMGAMVFLSQERWRTSLGSVSGRQQHTCGFICVP